MDRSPVRWLVIGIVDEHEPGERILKLGTVIGRVTLSRAVDSLKGGTILARQPVQPRAIRRRP